MLILFKKILSFLFRFFFFFLFYFASIFFVDLDDGDRFKKDLNVAKKLVNGKAWKKNLTSLKYKKMRRIFTQNSILW